MWARLAVLCALLTIVPRTAGASGHGPVFGGATPTLGKGAWQIDQAWLARMLDGSSDEQALRTMISMGLTERVQISTSFPVPLESTIFMLGGRTTSTMSSETDFEGMVAWRFQQRNLGPGTRIESTIFVGGAVPLQALRHDGMRAAPSFHVAASTGYISRSHYFWLNGGYHASAARGTDQMGDTGTVSVVYGYRPGFLRLDYPKPDLRFFVEGVAERSGVSQHHGFDVVPTGGNAIFVGPTALLLYKAYGIEGGVLFPVYDSNIYRVQEMRVAINFSYSFWRK